MSYYQIWHFSLYRKNQLKQIVTSICSMSCLLVILSRDIELSWKRISDVLSSRHQGPTQVSVYIDLSKNLVALLCIYPLATFEVLEEDNKVPQVLATIGGSFEYRLYQPLHLLGGAHTSAHILVMNSMTPQQAAEDMFNDWYRDEHIPFLQRVPSWLASERHILVSASNQAPRYLALHKFGETHVFNTEAYTAATNTPWRTEVINSVTEKERFVFTYKGELDTLATTHTPPL